MIDIITRDYFTFLPSKPLIFMSGYTKDGGQLSVPEIDGGVKKSTWLR